jgi:hypothetical protein
MDPQQRSEMLAKHLNLSSDQQAKVLDILKSEQSQMEKVHSDSSLAQQDRHSKMMDIHKTSSDQIRALLDSDQQMGRNAKPPRADAGASRPWPGARRHP